MPPQPGCNWDSRSPRASRSPRVARPGLYSLPAGDRARQSIPSESSSVHRVSWAAFRAAPADLPPEDKGPVSPAPLPQPAHPSEMNRASKSRSRRARGSTKAKVPARTPWYACRYTQYSCMMVLTNIAGQLCSSAASMTSARRGVPERLIEGYEVSNLGRRHFGQTRAKPPGEQRSIGVEIM